MAFVMACGGPRARERAERVEAVDPMPSTVEVVITPPALADAFRWEAETIARVLRTLEANLHAAPGVAVRIVGTPSPPSVARAPLGDSGPWRVTVTVVGSRGLADVRTLACAPQGACTENRVYASIDAPEPAAAELAAALMETIGIPLPDAPISCMTDVPSRDAYAALVAGRGAAVLYGLVEPTIVGDRSADPLERAVYLDPRMGLAQWVAGRGRLIRGATDGAAYALRVAHERCPDHQGFAADLARVELDAGHVRDAALIVDGLANDDDPRLVPLRLDTWIARDRLADAAELALRANQTFPEDARVARVMAELSRAQGNQEAYEMWLGRWSSRAAQDPEPVRRLVRIYAAEQRWTKAWDTLAELERRGAPDEARMWRVTAGLALGRYEDAAKAAPAEVAARIRARATLEGVADHQMDLGDEPSPEVHLARGTSLYQRGDPTAALHEAEAALRLRPWWPEGLALQADCLEAMGDRRHAAIARNQWRAAEPPETP